MNLAQFITYIKETSLRSPLIKQAIDGDVYQINSIENQYGIFCITPMSVTTSDNTMTINNTLFYVDRLVEGETNMNQIQSDGVTCLKTIIEEITNDEDVDISLAGDVTYTIFRHKFTDECAGVFAEVGLNVSNDDCEESYLARKTGGGVVTNLELHQPTVERFTVRCNPKFDTIYKLSTQDNAPLLLNRSSIETINGKRFFNIDIVWQNFFPETSPFQGFEQDEILFLFPRFAGINYTDYSNLIATPPRYSKQEFYELVQCFTVGCIYRCDTVNLSAVAIPCQISQLGEVINNTNGFFKSTTSTLNRNYHITGRYEIAEDWTIEEYNNYNFL